MFYCFFNHRIQNVWKYPVSGTHVLENMQENQKLVVVTTVQIFKILLIKKFFFNFDALLI